MSWMICAGCEENEDKPSQCDPVSQTGCSSSTQSAFTDKGNGETACFSRGSEPVGAACDYPDLRCDRASCSDGACSMYCRQDSNCPVAGARCIEIGHTDECGDFQPIPGAGVCTDQCQPWVDTSCGSGLACGSAGDVRDGFRCKKGGTGTMSCTTSRDCDPGRACSPTYAESGVVSVSPTALLGRLASAWNGGGSGEPLR